jgi:hypothetical protein
MRLRRTCHAREEMKIYANFWWKHGYIERGKVFTGFQICEKFRHCVTDYQLLKKGAALWSSQQNTAWFGKIKKNPLYFVVRAKLCETLIYNFVPFYKSKTWYLRPREDHRSKFSTFYNDLFLYIRLWFILHSSDDIRRRSWLETFSNIAGKNPNILSISILPIPGF